MLLESLHWVIEAFRDAECRIRTNAPANFATIKHMAINLLRSSKGNQSLQLKRHIAAHLDIHGIAATYATHQKQEVKDWLAKQPRFQVHFIPPSSAWLTLVERWFGSIPEKGIRRGVFKSVGELERAIYATSSPPTPTRNLFVGTKSATDIIRKVNRSRAALNIPPLVGQP